MKKADAIEKIMEVIISHKENTEECSIKAVNLIEIGKQLYEMGECPDAFSDILATAIIYAKHCSYGKELNEPIRELVKASLFKGVKQIMREAEL